LPSANVNNQKSSSFGLEKVSPRVGGEDKLGSDGSQEKQGGDKTKSSLVDAPQTFEKKQVVPISIPTLSTKKRGEVVKVKQDLIGYSKDQQRPVVIVVIDPKIDSINESAGSLIINTFASVLSGSTSPICLTSSVHQVDYMRIYQVIPDHVHMHLINSDELVKKECSEYVKKEADLMIYAISNQQASRQNDSMITFGGLLDLKIKASTSVHTKVITVVTQVDDLTEIPNTIELTKNGAHCSLRVIASRVDRLYPSNKIEDSTTSLLNLIHEKLNVRDGPVRSLGELKEKIDFKKDSQ